MTHTPLAIINFTPDSFSDGGNFFSVEKSLARIRYLKSIGVSHIDIGAQSTAPFNKDTGEAEEIRRLNILLNDDFIKEVEGMTFSLDSFRPSVVWFVWNKIKKNSPKEFIWNDVSGVLDGAVLDFLKESKIFSYVLCHNLVSKREATCAHMDYVISSKGSLFVKSVVDFFDSRLKKLPLEYRRQIILDNCYGFAKSLDQNYLLIKNQSLLEESFPDVKGWLVGVSRKSFLRKIMFDNILSPVASPLEQNSLLSVLEISCVRKFFNRECNYYIRTHVPENFVAVSKLDMITKA